MPAKRPSKPNWSSPKNAHRARPLLSVTMSRDGQEALEQLANKTKYSRGVVVETLVLAERRLVDHGPEERLSYLTEQCAKVAGRSQVPDSTGSIGKSKKRPPVA